MYLIFFFQITKEEFTKTIKQINSYFQDAEEVTCTTFIEGCVGCLSFFSLFLCYTNHYKQVDIAIKFPYVFAKVLRQLDEYLQSENETLYSKHGLEILNPLANGLLEVSFITVTVLT